MSQRAYLDSYLDAKTDACSHNRRDKLLPRVGCTMCSLGDIIYIYGGQVRCS